MIKLGRPEHHESDWKQIQEDLIYVRDNSGLKPPQIYRRIGIAASQFSLIVNHAGCGLKAAKRVTLTEMVNEIRTRINEKPIEIPARLDLEQGMPINLTSREVEIRVLKSIIQRHEKVWVVEFRLNEKTKA